MVASLQKTTGKLLSFDYDRPLPSLLALRSLSAKVFIPLLGGMAELAIAKPWLDG
jgi:hypothetical protein